MLLSHCRFLLKHFHLTTPYQKEFTCGAFVSKTLGSRYLCPLANKTFGLVIKGNSGKIEGSTMFIICTSRIPTRRANYFTDSKYRCIVKRLVCFILMDRTEVLYYAVMLLVKLYKSLIYFFFLPQFKSQVEAKARDLDVVINGPKP